MNWQVFLDLEETIIDNWGNQELINVQRIGHWLAQHHVKSVSIFSFAIWNAADQMKFWEQLAPRITRALGVDIDSVPSLEEVWRADTKNTGIRFDNLADFLGMRGKSGAFQNWSRWCCQGANTVLIDDVVPDQETHWPRAQQRVVTVNVTGLEALKLGMKTVSWCPG